MYNVINSLRRWHMRNVAITELGRMSDHLLDDIGIARGEIPGVVRDLK